ncbi:Transthyretin-like family protein [Caenorhabditis elegans]|uniref:Transthyretin-like family protein n=1 Tax=Caenorhabditis elegans TaxID=6239 RepID=O16586_CAEEL|nr:Transthyretin-like family protein [Caenorhabditis elegans]CCD69803.1 Transthyretin-like family protein [Caenorhabditis elegans]|eukprot:NP_508245.1 TransThyretin-Related family domain [Caenorhabditis elegans]
MRSLTITIFLSFYTLQVAPRAVEISDELPIQAISASGRLFCGDKPLIGIPVKLIDKDHGDDRDDLLDEKKTDEEGKFHVTGGTYEKAVIEPALKIYHDCNDGNHKCQKRLFWDIPQKYVSTDLYKIPVFDLGSINLELGFGNEKRDCRH